MFELIKGLFKTDQGDDAGIDPQLAAAALMFEVVWADHDIDDSEMQSMAALLQDIFTLDQSRVNELVALTRANHDASVGVFPFTRALNEQLDAQEKYLVLKAMWSIAYADAHIDAFEEHTIRRIADLLYVPHQRFIEAKRAARAEREA